jgi:hypothetical protein
MTAAESELYGLSGDYSESYPNERLMEGLTSDDVCELFVCNRRTAVEYNIHTLKVLDRRCGMAEPDITVDRMK